MKNSKSYGKRANMHPESFHSRDFPSSSCESQPPPQTKTIHNSDNIITFIVVVVAVGVASCQLRVASCWFQVAAGWRTANISWYSDDVHNLAQLLQIALDAKFSKRESTKVQTLQLKLQLQQRRQHRRPGRPQFAYFHLGHLPILGLGLGLGYVMFLLGSDPNRRTLRGSIYRSRRGVAWEWVLLCCPRAASPHADLRC